MQTWAYLADWDRLLQEWPADGDEPLLGELVDDGADWVALADMASDSVIVSTEIGELFRAIEPKLRKEDAQILGTFLTAFSFSLAEDGSSKPVDLGRASDIVLSSLSPLTVGKYLAMHSQIAMDRILPVARAALTSGSFEPVTERSLVIFMDMWAEVLSEAHRKGWGVLVCAG